MSPSILHRLADQVDLFLALWTEKMKQAGYLDHTTAKREDCMLSFRWFLAPLIRALEQEGEKQTYPGKEALPSFGELIFNPADWAENFVLTSRRHRARGITGGMFMGCFKTLVHAILEMVDQGEEAPAQKKEAYRLIRLWSDALETLIVQDWTALSRREADQSLDQANRRLTLEKCKYENVIDAISDLVLTIDRQGCVIEANRSARRYFDTALSGQHIRDVLGITHEQLTALYAGTAVEAAVETSAGAMYFQCAFAALNQVSLASDEYLVILNDVTARVRQSEILETIVAERTSELLNKTGELEEMNVTLRTVMASVDKERQAFQKSISEAVRSALLPALTSVRKETSADIRKAYLDIVEDQLLKLDQTSGADQQAGLLKLTPMEMKISRFIKAGISTKEIAEALNLSVVTIQTHRRNIRRKLGLLNCKVNLTTFLNQSGPSGDNE